MPPIGGIPTKPKRKVKTKPKAAPKYKVTVPDAKESTRSRRSTIPTPDQADRTRTPVQKKHDAAVVKKTVKDTRELGKQNEKLKPIGFRKDTLHSKPRVVDEDKRQRAMVEFKAKSSKQATEGYAPVLRVLKETTRINHAVAGAADAAVTHKSVPKAALKGIKNESDTSFSDVLKHAGVKNKTVRGAAGFALDVGTDPTTYLTLGAGSVAAKSAGAAAKSAERTALKKGLTQEQAAKMAERARTQTERKGNQAKGVTVKLAGKEVPGVRKATAAAGKPARAAGRKAVPQKVRDAARSVAADVNPDVAPAGVAKETSQKAVQATRTARAKANRGTHEAQQHAVGIRKQVGEQNYSRIIDAIENGTIGKLPPELRDAAVRIRSQFRHANRQRKQAGIRGGEIKHRSQVKVPEVTADTTASARARNAARRAEAAAHREHEAATQAHDIHQGRAEVLSRNVSGSNAEKAAERGRRKRKVKLAPKYAGGGHGVNQTATALKTAAKKLEDATNARVAADAAHEVTKVEAAAQRKAQRTAEETNAKRAAAPKEYIPHNLTDDALEAEGKAAKNGRGTGRKVIRPTSSRARTDNRPLSVLRDEQPGRYSEDLPNLYANHKVEGATSVARAELNRRIADLGKKLPSKGKDIPLEAGEGVYHITGSDIRQVTDKKELARLAETGSHSGPIRGRYVVLNDDIVKRALEGVTPQERSAIGAGYDKAQAGFKRIALATPGFHVRNLVGDTQNAYLGQAGHRLPGNMVDAGRVLKAEGRRDKSLRSMTPGETGGGTIKTGRYGKVSYDEVAKRLGEHGGMRSGYVGRELPELSGEKATARRVRLPRRAKQAFLNREDLPRLTTAVEALKKGATWEEAAQKVADYHFDYSHLTRFERTTARRVLPFYTFTARNIPRQFKSLATHPGKFANYQKLIEEASKTVGMDEEAQKHRAQVDQLKAAGVTLPKGWQSMLSEWEQRNAGVPVNWRGHKFTVSFGLPLASGLNELPGAAGKKQADEYFQTAMSLVSPIVKDPVEYFGNYSFFFRDQIENDASPLVSAPSYVGALPEKTRKDLGVVRGLDKRTNKLIWRWPGKVDYIVKTVPGLPQYAQQFATEGTNRRGKGTGGKALQLFGVRAEPFDPDRTITNLAYERVGAIEKRQAAIRQSVNPKNGLAVSAKNPTPEYIKLSQQLKIAQKIAFQGQQAQGYKVLPKTGAPPKGHGSSGRIKIPGVGGRVKVPGVGGRIKIP